MSIPMLHYRETFDRLYDALPGAGVPWLTLMRNTAMAEFQQRPFPDTRSEAWKYTDLRGLNRRLYSPLPSADTLAADALQPWLFDAAPMHRLVFVDGHLVPGLSAVTTPSQGITLRGVAAVLERHPAPLEGVLGRTLVAQRPGFDAMNTAFMQDGAWLRLEPGVKPEQPLHLLFICTGQTRGMATLRNIIELGPGSAATVIESWVALHDAECLTNTITEVALAPGAALEHYTLQQQGTSGTHIGGLYVHQARDSRLAAHNFALGGRLVRNELQVDLDGAGAECSLNGLVLARRRQHVDNHTRIDHRAARATSNEWYRSILMDRSRSVFSGRITVHPDAQQTVAQQSNHSLLLSNEAEADARPQFEIRADDVQCTHGCTVGELDPDALFYLRSRALEDAVARRLLIRAFAADILERVRTRAVREELEQQLACYLESGTVLH